MTKLVDLLIYCWCFTHINIITINAFICRYDIEISKAIPAINISLLLFSLLILIQIWGIITLSRIIRSLSKYIFLFTRSLFINHISYCKIVSSATLTKRTCLITKIKSVNNFTILAFPFIFLKTSLLFNFF